MDSGDFKLPSIDGIEFVNYTNEEQLDDVMRLVSQDLSEPYSSKYYLYIYTEQKCVAIYWIGKQFQTRIYYFSRVYIIYDLTLHDLHKVFTYRYFLHRWPQLCILAVPTNDDNNEEGFTTKKRPPIGCVVCKIDIENDNGDPVVDEQVNDEDVVTKSSIYGGSANNLELKDDSDIQGNITQKLPPLPNGKVYSGYIGMLAVEKKHRRSGIATVLVQRVIHRMQQLGCQSIRLETEVTNKGALNLYENRLGFIREELLIKYYLNWNDAHRLRLWLDG